MSSTSGSGIPAPSTADQFMPFFIVGVTGDIDPIGYLHLGTPGVFPARSIAAIDRFVFQFIRWLQHAPESAQPTGRFNPANHRWLPRENTARDTKDAYHSCWQPLRLKETPIVFLTSLAPGIDTLVTEAVFRFQKKFRKRHPSLPIPVTIRAALPFPEIIYRDCSLFPTPEARTRYDALLAQLKLQEGFDAARDIFCVPLHESISADPLLDANPLIPQLQRRRARAAGEYIAAYSDILLAFYDEVHATAENLDLHDPFIYSPAAIVEAKRRGLTDRLLPIPQTISWADTGPVLHIPIDREERTHIDILARNRPLRLLQPYDALPDGPHLMVSQADLYPKWQENGDRILRETAKNFTSYLEGLSGVQLDVSDPKILLTRLLSVGGPHPDRGDDHPLSKAVQKILHCPVQSFGALGALRDKTATIARERDAEVKAKLDEYFLLAIFSILFFVLSGMSWDALLPKDSPWGNWISGTSFAVALGLMIRAILRHKSFTRSRIEDKQFDARGIAEGMRIQFYWSVAGLFASVASRYIQRLRGELGWIRYVISSVSFPYQRTQDWFAKLEVHEQYQILCGVRDGWLRGQIKYFRKNSHTGALLRDSWRIIGKVFVIAAFVVVADAVYLGIFGSGLYSLLQPLSPWVVSISAGAAILLSILWGTEEFFRRSPWFPCSTEESEVREKVRRHYWRCLFPSLWHDYWQTSQQKSQQIIQRLHKYLTWIIASMLALLLCLCPPWFPGWKNFDWQVTAAITGGLKSLLLAFGGLAFLWVDKKFFEEDHRRYSAMLQLFSGAEQRMSHKLERLNHQLGLTPPPPTAPEIVKDIQDLLLHLGQEALTENAEWIVMRRTRRIEPITPDL